MGDVANCKLGYFTQWNDAEHSTGDNASSVPYYLQCHITRTYPMFEKYFNLFWYNILNSGACNTITVIMCGSYLELPCILQFDVLSIIPFVNGIGWFCIIGYKNFLFHLRYFLQ